MRVCILSKFPPIEGGIAAKTYWLARGLGESGIEVEVLTNANSVESEYRIHNLDWDHLKSLKNVRVNNIEEKMPWHIPFSTAFAIRLLNIFLKIHRENKIDLIDSGFLMPYGIVAYLGHKITGTPYIIRHGGSDIYKFKNHPEFNELISLALKNASLIITDEEHLNQFSKVNNNVKIIDPYVPNKIYFKSMEMIKDSNAPAIGYIGKINYHWRNKGLQRVIDVLDNRFDDYHLTFVSQGKGLEDFQSFFKSQESKGTIEFRQFVAPWEMPQLLQNFNYIISAPDSEIRNRSNSILEALACKKEIIDINGESIVKKRVPGNNFKSWLSTQIKEFEHL